MGFLARMQDSDGDSGTHAEAEANSEADAFVDVEIGAVHAIEAGGQFARPLAERGSSKSRPVHLPAVRVAAEHQVAAAAFQVLDRVRVMRQHDARYGRAEPVERLTDVAHATPQVFHAGEI